MSNKINIKNESNKANEIIEKSRQEVYSKFDEMGVNYTIKDIVISFISFASNLYSGVTGIMLANRVKKLEKLIIDLAMNTDENNYCTHRKIVAKCIEDTEVLNEQLQEKIATILSIIRNLSIIMML